MAVREHAGPGLRRAARSRAGFVALACALYLAAGLSATWPSVLHARSQFLSGGAPGHGEASPGDHLQTLYHWWLVGDQIEHGRAPWRDPYSFRPEAGQQANLPGWPYGFVFWPLDAAFGAVAGWNLMQLLLYVLAGLCACAWLLELGLPRGPALAGGLAFSIAPYRVAQSVGHLLGPIAVLLPLSLWAFERARRGSAWWLVVAAAALASIPLSGQVHLALGAIPFFLAYALVRAPRLWRGALACVVAAVGAGVLVRQTVIVGSTQSGGRSLDEVAFYSARVGDFFTRHVDHARSEQFVFLGWITPLLALAGLVLLWRERRRGLAVVLGLGALVPLLLALGTRTPLYTILWHALPPFRFPRVPERLLPIACLCIAALVAIVIARIGVPALTVVAIVVLFLDLHVRLYGKSFPDNDNRAYAALAATPTPGRLLELPVFDPGVHYGSVYLWYGTRVRRQRLGGYSTTAPKAAKTLARRLERLNCGDWSGDTQALLRRLGVVAVTFHRGLFVNNSAVPDTTYFAWRGLVEHGWSAQEASGVVWLAQPNRSGPPQNLAEPARDRAYFCQGWYGQFGPLPGRFMSERHAPLWIYGSGTLRLTFGPSELPRRYTVDGRVQPGPLLRLGSPGWHIVTVDVPRLVPYRGKQVGARLLALFTYP